MLQEIRQSVLLIVASVRIFLRYPKLLVPLLVTWLVYGLVFAALGLHHLNQPLTATHELAWELLGVVFGFPLLLVLSCGVMLEMMVHLENGRPPALLTTLGTVLTQSLWRMLPLIGVWTVVWFMMHFPVRQKRSARRHMLQKGVRMIVFLILPGIILKRQGFWRSVQDAGRIFERHLVKLATGFLLSSLVHFVLYVPPVALLLYYKAMDPILFAVSLHVWMFLAVYTPFACVLAFIWSRCMRYSFICGTLRLLKRWL